MAVTFDAVGPSSAGTSINSTTLSWSHTCSGTERLLTVGVAVSGGITTNSITATYNSVSMTSAGRVFSNNQNDGWVELFYLVAPATGSNTVLVTCDVTRTLIGGSVSFNGVDQSTPVDTAVTGFDDGTPAPSLTVSSATGDMVVDAVCTGTGVTSSSQTNRWLKNVEAITAAGNAAQSTADGAASVNMAYTISTDWWGMIAMNINQAVAASPTNTAWLTA